MKLFDAARADDRVRTQTQVHLRESGLWVPHLRVDTFTGESVEQCRRALGVLREPSGPELLAWARHDRGVAVGDGVFGDSGNLLTRLGLRRLLALYCGETATASQALNVTHLRVAVGNSATAAATTDTDLGAAAGSSNRQYKLVDSVSVGTGANSGVLTAVATFGASVANFAWLEWAMDGGTADGTTVTSEAASTPGLQNHRIFSASPLTKASPTVAVATVTVTVA